MVTRRSFLKIGGLSVSTIGFVDQVLGQQTPQQQARLENMVKDVKPLTPEDYEARRDQAGRLMKKQKIDGLFLISSPDMLYFTNMSTWVSERTTGVILSQKRNPVWVVPAFELEGWKERIPSDQKIRAWEEHESPYKLIAGVMKDLGAPNGRMGVGPQVREFQIQGLKRDAAHLQLVDGAKITEGCRGIKTEKELAYMELANKITKLAFREGFKSLREGMSPGDLSSAISAAHRQMGVSGSGGPQFGLGTAFPHGSQVARTLKEGDAVMVDGGCSIERFSSDVTRTVVFGKPTDKHRKVFDIVRKAQLAVMKTARPGAACEQVDAAARKVIEDAGFGPGYKYFPHRVGHGIGMEGHEYPYLVKGNTLKLAPGMTFSNEPGIYLYGEFGIRIEDCFVVTENEPKFFGGLEATAIDMPFGE
ncbi:MAG: Xaa-Pro peptidase family protein [bacterium]